MIPSQFRSAASAALALGLIAAAVAATARGPRTYRDDRYHFSLGVPEPWAPAGLGGYQVPGVIRAAWSGPSSASITVFVQEPGEPVGARYLLRRGAKVAKEMGYKVPVEEVRAVDGKPAMWLVEAGKGTGGTIGIDGGVETTAHWVAIPCEVIVVVLLTCPSADYEARLPSFLAAIDSLKIEGKSAPEGAGPGDAARVPAAEGLNLGFEQEGDSPARPKGWFLSGDGFRRDAPGYEVGLDDQAKAGRHSLKMKATGRGAFGNAFVSIPGRPAAGKHIKIIGHIKTEGVTSGYAGIWCRVDGPDGTLAHDNMAVRLGPGGALVKVDDRGVRGTTPWARYQVEHDVPEGATSISFGALLTGDGAAWFDEFSAEVDGVPVVAGPREPRATGAAMAEPPGWGKAVSNGADYDAGIDRSVAHAGKASARIEPIVAEPDGQSFGNLMQTVGADEFRGKRIAVSAYVKTRDVTEGARMWARIDGATRDLLGFDNMQKRPLLGTGDWKRCEIVLDVPEDAAGIAFGVMLAGKGRVWFDDVAFAVVAADVPTTDLGLPATPLTEAQRDGVKARYRDAPKRPRNLDFEQ